jgi:tetratricopeptide (TPR) repeat protein
MSANRNRNVWKNIATLACAGVLAAAVGCNKDPNAARRLNPQEQAQQKFNRIRSSVDLSLAKTQFENADYVNCRKSLTKALTQSPDSVPALILLTKLDIEEGKLDAAEKSLNRAREIDPKNAEADYLSGVVAQRWQKNEQALEFYTRACENAPGELHYLLARAEMLVALDQRGKALEILQEKLTYFENSAAIRDAVGQLLVQGGNYPLACRILRQASILAPDEQQIQEHLGLAYFYAKNYPEALPIFEKLLRDEKNAKRVDLLVALGECQMQLDKPRDARDNFELAAQLQPAAVTNWLNLGKVGLQLNDLKRAEMSLKKALTIDPAKAETHLIMGYLRLQQNRLDDALGYFGKANTLDPKDTTSLCMVGYVLERKGRSNDAIRCYARALKLKPNDELASTLLAKAQTASNE